MTLNCRGRLLVLERPLVMGILNVTPDSFSDGGLYLDPDRALAHAAAMLRDGAAIIDIGGMSSRPGADIIPVADEMRRVLPVIQRIHKAFPEAILSIDTVHAEVADAAIEAGVSIINDISAGAIDPEITDVALKHDAPYVLMHMRGTPADMQQQTDYEDVALEVLDFLIAHITKLREKGLEDIIVDPGFGFGKTLEQNYALLARLHTFKILEAPILVGLSRKSMIYKALDKQPDEVLAPLSALHWMALEQGARILRVHDVAPAMDVIRIYEIVQQTKTS